MPTPDISNPEPSLPDVTDVTDLLASLVTSMSWAESEIAAAQGRHPDAADPLWSSFVLLRPTHPLMRTEMVYRAHCRELLERVADGADTRPGTAAECCIALSEVSQDVALRHSAVGLYARMWRLAGLPPIGLEDNGIHYEALEGSVIDEHESWLRGRLAQSWRVLPPPETGSPDLTA